jgi:uncharacterized protein (TIGR02001 family)
MKKTALLLLAAAAGVMPSLASAQAAASPLTGNFTLATDYRFRGISQTYKQPTVQGGIDWAHASGLYLGNWNSSVSGNSYPNGAGIEMDFYGGYKFPMGKDVTIDVGGLYYYYPGAHYNVAQRTKFDNFELYAGATMGPFSAKIFFAITDFFGLDSTTSPLGKGSSGSYYLDLNYSTEIMPKLTLGAHLGYQNVRNHSDWSYVDYKLGVTYDWTGWMLGAALVGTNADKAIYTVSNASGSKAIGQTGLVLSISKTF